MASPNESSSSRKRLGRRRLPPLEPGPALQFVVANHPDQFRAGKTMRHVRSHVMYKHRTERKTVSSDRQHIDLQRSASACASSTASPALASSDTSASDADYFVPTQSRPRSGTWSGPLPFEHTTSVRSLTQQILSSAQGICARSAPPVFEHASAFPFPEWYGPDNDILGSLKSQYIETTTFFCQDTKWMQAICADQLSFLSHVTVSSVYQDLADGLWHDSGTTVGIKTHTLSTIAGQLESNDATILSILHLLLSEVGGDEAAFSVHYQGLQGLIHRRGGLSQLPYHLATYVVLHLTTLAMLKRLPELTPHPTTSPTLRHTQHPSSFPSPLYAPHGTFASLSNTCSPQTLEIVIDMFNLTQAFTRPGPSGTTFIPTHHDHHTHARLHHPPPSQPLDWVHETIRLASLLYTHAIIHKLPFSSAANTPHHHPTTGNTTLLSALLHAIEHTEVNNCWGNMRGVFLWVCLIGGAAAWGSTGDGTAVSPRVAWARKCFSMWAIRAVVGVGFEFKDAIMEGLRVGLEVRRLLDGRGSDGRGQ